ncbi:unnamed protein product [Cochlearia groenlandica]
MGNDENLIVIADSEEGEVSVSSKPPIQPNAAATTAVENGGGGGSSGSSRVWTMQDLLDKYPSYRGYANSGLINIAWARAVQNKPLNEGLLMDIEPRERDDKIVIDVSEDEKEEGEIEEGEIDLEDYVSGGELASRALMESEEVVLISDNEDDDDDDDDGIEKERDLEMKVKLIRVVLESTSLVEAQTVFEGVCSRLLGALESLRELVSDNGDFPKRDTLVQLSFASLQTVNSVFCTMNDDSKLVNKEAMSRLLSLVNDNFSRFLSTNQINEIESMNQNLIRSAISLNAGTSSEENVNQMTQTSNGDYVLTKNQSLEGTNRGPFYGRSRLPLLDLHKDHDADSLPSPTRETTPSLPLNSRHTMVRPGLPFGKEGPGNEVDKVKAYPYGREALKAVSTYQKNFNIFSTFKMDDLPSPTASGEEPNDVNGDMSGEVYSSVVMSSKPGTLRGQDVPLPSNFYSRSMHVTNTTVSSSVSPQYSVSASTGATQTLLAADQTTKPSAKSRDPRLRLAKPDVDSATMNLSSSADGRNITRVETFAGLVDPRKQKAADKTFIDGTVLKRQKIDKDAPKADGVGGWLKDIVSGLQKPESKPARVIDNEVTSMTTSVMPKSFVSVSQKVSKTASADATSLTSLLKDIAVNPAMLLNLIKMGEKQKILEKAPQKPFDPRRATQLPGSSVPPRVSPPLSVTSSNALATSSPKPGVIQDSSQYASSDESGSIRMKPRDPRRVLHGSTLQRTDSLVENQPKVNGSPTLRTLVVKGKMEELEIQNTSQNGTSKTNISGELLSGKTPDISTLFTNNLKSIADMVVVSQKVGNSVDLKTDNSKHNPLNPTNQEGVSVSAAVAGPVRTMNSWGDVKHLFDRYDEKQIVAIQRERNRRLEEQKKMFASQKLSLVLDLDHTLLNSAKFHEVEPVHDEKLRKKEEQDREKPYRHLFRFSHMGMWTKLRPGIWNFLEKASKLYELHLYTMGNKMYATEMAKLLDPKGVLFNGRVISKGDDGDLLNGDERVPKSKDLEGVMGMESSVVIIDDSVRVWPQNKMNLIAVERYTYFPCSRRQFGLLGPSLLEIDHDEVPDEGTLASSLAVIERIHKNFFSHTSLDEADVRNILASEQRKILSGCRIVFSRIIPVGEAKPHLHPLWQLAEQFGAVCTTQVDENVTHVVTNSLGTDKVNWALTRGKFVVHHGWVEASAFLYRRANEKNYPINP